MVDIAQLRHAKDDYFKRAPDSPLTLGDVEEIEMSNGSTTRMRRVGVVHFDLGGELVAFEQGEELFIPFRDGDERDRDVRRRTLRRG